MGGWNDILKEVQETQSQYDYVRSIMGQFSRQKYKIFIMN